MTVILFIISLLITAAVFVFCFEINKKNITGRMKSVPLGLTFILLIISLLFFFGIINPGRFLNVLIFESLISGILCFVTYKDFGEYKKEQRFIIRTIIIAAVLELSLFNMPAYKIWSGDYPVKEVGFESVEIEEGGITEENGIRITSEELFEGVIKNVDIPVCNLKIDLKFADSRLQTINFGVDTKDETQSLNYRNDIVKGDIITYRPDTEYIQCDLSGKVSEVRFRLYLKSGEDITLSKVTFNSGIPFNIQYIRFIIITVLASFIYSIISGGYMAVRFSDNRQIINMVTYFITVGFLAAAFFTIDYKMTDKSWTDCFHQESGNQVTEELVEAFKKGHVYLDRETEDFLYEIDNPYDDNQRLQAGGSFAWDHVLYGDHYYSYYGIAPVFVLFLPYNLITGYYCANEFAILFFTFIAVCGVSMAFLSFVRKWFSDISSGIYITCLFILQLSSGIWYSVGRVDFYEISLTAGLAFISWGIYFMFESNIIDREKISCVKSVFASLFLALAVLSRPTLAVYCICAAVFMLAAVTSYAGSSVKGVKKYISASSVKYMLCAFGPMVTLGLVQMIYNYTRFGSPFDFGIQYSLTINDFTKSQFHLKFCAVALYNYLFNPPVFLAEYPFVKTQFQYLHSTGYFYVDVVNTLNTSGLFMLVPLTWFYLASRRAMRTFGSRREKIITLLKIVVPCLAAPFIIIMSVWESGYAVRYMGDFSLEIILGAYALMFLIIRSSKNPSIHRLINYFVCFSLVWVIYTEGIQIINQAFRYQEGHYSFPEIAHSLERIISFWR